MMPDTPTLVLYALLVFVRLWGLRARWTMATYRGEGWFFDSRVEGDAVLRRYRFWLIATSIPFELAALADLLTFGSLRHVVFLHGPATMLLGVVRNLILRALVLGTREQTAGAVALSLAPRRLADYTSVAFESINTFVAIASLVLIAQSPWPPLLGAGFLVYVEIGALLWKRSLLRRPVVLPEEGADEYLRLTEDVSRTVMRQLDLVRACCTLVLVLLAVKATWWDAFAESADRIGRVALAALIAISLLALLQTSRRARALMLRARALNVPRARVGLRDPENLRLGGLVYVNRENPAVIVDAGPLRLSVNVMNWITYVYAGYWIGWAVLMTKLAEAV